MNATNDAVDLAKLLLQLPVADAPRKVIDTHRVRYSLFERFFATYAIV